MLRPPLKRRLIFLTAMAALNLFVFGAQARFVRDGYSDFMHFYATGKLVRSGQARAIYDPQAQLTEQRPISEAVRSTGVPVAYMHPPFEALLFAGLAWLPYFAAYWAWAAINLAVLLAVLWMLRRELPGLRDLPQSWLVVIALAFYPVINSFAEGQDNILLLALIALALVALRRRAEWMAGVWLGLGMVRPQIVLPLMLVMLCAGRWKVVAGFAATVAGWVAVTAAVFGWQIVVEYPQHVMAAERGSYVAQTLVRHMPNLHGLAAALFPGAPRAALVAVLLLSLAVMGVAVWVWRAWRDDALEMAFAVVVLAALLVSYHSFVHDLSLLLLVVLVMVDWQLAKRSDWRSAWWAGSAIAVPMLVLFVPPLALGMVLRGWFHWYALGLMACMAGIIGIVTSQVSSEKAPAS